MGGNGDKCNRKTLKKEQNTQNTIKKPKATFKLKSDFLIRVSLTTGFNLEGIP